MTNRTVSRSMAEARASNRTCKHPNCSLPVFRIGSWCKDHAHKVHTFGHPDGTYVGPKDYAQERLEVAELIKAHTNHQGLQAATAWFEEWQNAMVPSDPRKALPGLSTMWRLKARDVSPQTILIEAAAVFLYSYRFPNRLPSDEQLTVLLGKAISKLTPCFRLEGWGKVKPRYDTPKQSELKAIGRRVRDTLGRLLLNVTDTIQSQAAAKQNLLLSMSAPFNADTLNPTYLMNLPGVAHKPAEQPQEQPK